MARFHFWKNLRPLPTEGVGEAAPVREADFIDLDTLNQKGPLDSEQLRQFFEQIQAQGGEERMELLGRLAERPDCPEDLFFRLQQEAHPEVWLGLAINEHTPGKILQELTHSHIIEVLFGLARNPQIPRRTISQWVRRKEHPIDFSGEKGEGVFVGLQMEWMWEQVLRLILKNPQLSATLMRRFSQHKNPYLRTGVALNPNLMVEALCRLLDDPDLLVRAVVAQNAQISMSDNLKAFADLDFLLDVHRWKHEVTHFQRFDSVGSELVLAMADQADLHQTSFRSSFILDEVGPARWATQVIPQTKDNLVSKPFRAYFHEPEGGAIVPSKVPVYGWREPGDETWLLWDGCKFFRGCPPDGSGSWFTKGEAFDGNSEVGKVRATIAGAFTCGDGAMHYWGRPCTPLGVLEVKPLPEDLLGAPAKVPQRGSKKGVLQGVALAHLGMYAKWVTTGGQNLGWTQELFWDLIPRERPVKKSELISTRREGFIREWTDKYRMTAGRRLEF